MTLPKPVRSLFYQRYQPRHALPRPQPAPLFDHQPGPHRETWPPHPAQERDSQPRVAAGRDVKEGQA